MTKQNILKQIRRAGVIGAGGAGFPAYKKLETDAEHIIANGVECEPLLYKDRETMVREKERFIEGLRIIRNMTGARKVTIALKSKNKDIADMLEPLASPEGMDIFIMNDIYPAGDEYILVYDVTGRRIPVGGYPTQIGVVVNNVETIVNVAYAVRNKPVTHKFVTITGAVKEPVTAYVPIGIGFADCIALAGGVTINNPVILTDGVMMGGVERDFTSHISKTSGGLIVLPENHPIVVRKTAPRKSYMTVGHSACDQCSFCTELCPRYLLGYPIQPHLVMRSLQFVGNQSELLSRWAGACCECNICSLFACPESLDPKSICVDTKDQLRETNGHFTAAELSGIHLDVHPRRKGREVPVPMLYQRLGLKRYDRKAPFHEVPVMPKSVCIPLDSHVGSPAKPTVERGDFVRSGDIIADVSEASLGCPVHASIDGIVTEITSMNITISDKQ